MTALIHAYGAFQRHITQAKSHNFYVNRKANKKVIFTNVKSKMQS